MGNLMNIPEIRFPEFKDDWEHKELNELLSESKKKNTDLKYSKEEVLSVSGELGIVNQIEHLGRSYAGASVHNYGVVEVGDIVYTKSPLKANPYGIIKINKGKAGIVSTLYAVYKVNEKTAYGDFLDYYFSLDANTNRYLRPLVRKGAKNDMKINNEYVLHDRIFVPTIPEQKRIAHFFSVLDKKINQLKEKKALLEEYKKGVVQFIFSDKTIKHNHWTKNQIGFLFDERSEKGFDELELLSVSINTGIQKKSNTTKNDNSSKDKSNYKKVLPNDIVYNSMRMWQGASGVSLYKGIVSPAYTVLKPKTKLNSLFFGYLFKTHTMVYTFRRFSQGLTSDTWNIKYSQISKLNIHYPNCIKEQDDIVNLLSKIDNKINTINEQIEETKEYKKGLLQRMYCV